MNVQSLRSLLLIQRAGCVAQLAMIDELLAETREREIDAGFEAIEKAGPGVAVKSTPLPAPQPIPSAEPAVDTRLFYPERNAIIRAAYPAGVPNPEIKAKLDALPGRAVPLQRISVQAAFLGLKRPTQPPQPPQPVKPVLSKSEVMARLATVRAPVVRVPTLQDLTPVEASYDQIASWAAVRGLGSHPLDLEAVNRKRLQLGLAPFLMTVRKKVSA